MTGTVLLFDREQSLSRAWAEYQAHASRSYQNRDLLLDREYVAEWARLEDRFKRLTLMTESPE